MTNKEIFEKLKAEFGDAIIDLVEEQYFDAYINVAPEKILEICLSLRDNAAFNFDYCVNLTGMDYKDSLGVVYHLRSMKHSHTIVIKVKLSKESPKIDSVERVWRTADWHEREAFDMYGIEFVGHHNMIRILCPYDWEGYPLRKDYVFPEEYHGMKVPN